MSVAIRERSILFRGPMVRAIRAGQKSQTRRVVKGDWVTAGDKSGLGYYIPAPSPYGQPGDRLWVRETWQYADWTEDGVPHIRYAGDGEIRVCNPPTEWEEKLHESWAALSDPVNYAIDSKAADRRWRSSIHMPRWASRITLEITDLRVERLQEITPLDAGAEGICIAGNHEYGVDGVPMASTPVDAFAALWDGINAQTHSWSSNPWVWAITFRLLDAEGRPQWTNPFA